MIRRLRAWRSRPSLGVAAGLLVVAVGLPVAAILALNQSPSIGASDEAATVVWAVGDGADGGDAAKEVVERMQEGDIDRLLYLGDIYEIGSAEEFEANYDSVYGELAGITSPVIGNHEFHEREEGYLPYWEEVRGERQPLYYSFDLGGWELIGLNSEPEGEIFRIDEQLEFIEDEVSEDGDCRLAFWHTSRYSAVPDGDERFVEPLWDALAEHAVLVVSGHEHNMQRIEPVDGITQLVSGAGGHGLYDIDEGDPKLEWGNDTDYGALRLELDPGVARYEFIASDGQVLDSGDVTCRELEDEAR